LAAFLQQKKAINRHIKETDTMDHFRNTAVYNRLVVSWIILCSRY